MLKEAGYKKYHHHNPSRIGRGKLTEAQYRAVEAEILSQIGPGLVDATYFCPDAPWEPSTRRKPLPAWCWRLPDAHNIDLAGSFFVGDKTSDIECGRNAGTHTILVQTGYGSQQDDALP